jgi:hypothetical protein
MTFSYYFRRALVFPALDLMLLLCSVFVFFTLDGRTPSKAIFFSCWRLRQQQVRSGCLNEQNKWFFEKQIAFVCDPLLVVVDEDDNNNNG